MAITISGENNNDRILASDGVIDQISGINIVGLITASHINVGSNINLGNAGIITATTFVGNLTGNVNSTSPLLLQTGGSERFRITGDNALGIAGANYGSSGQVLTSGGSGSAVTWSAIPSQVSISNNADNRVITGGSGVNLNGESTLTYDGTSIFELQPSSATPARFIGDANRTGQGQHLAQFEGNWNGTLVSRIVFAAGADTTNKDDGIITMHTTPSGGSNQERLRIDTNGDINLGNNPTNQYGYKLNIQDSAIIYAQTASSGGTELKLYLDHGNTIANFGTVSSSHLAFVTANTEKLRITSGGEIRIGGAGADGGYQLNVIDESNRTTTAETALLLYAKHDGSGTTGAGFGTGIRFWGDRASGNVEQNMGRIMCIADVNSGTTLSSAFVFETGVAGVLGEKLRIASTGQVSISSDGTTDGLLTIKGDSDQVGTPSIRLLDGSDTREVSITNTSGDFVASVHGNDNAIHGHIKMFESGIFDINSGGASGSNTNRLRIASDGQLTHTANKNSGYTAIFNQSHADNPAYIEINSPTDNDLRPAYIQLSRAGSQKWGIGQVYASTSAGSFHIGTGSHSQSNSKFTITTAGRIGVGNVDPGGAANGSIDITTSDNTTGHGVLTDQRGRSSLVIRNKSGTLYSYSQLMFTNGNDGYNSATFLRHTKGGYLQNENFIGDLILMTRVAGNGSANPDFREKTTWPGGTTKAKQIWWANGTGQQQNGNHMGWHRFAEQNPQGNSQYQYFTLDLGSASYSRAGLARYTILWNTGHASGTGHQTGEFRWFNHHTSLTCNILEHIILRRGYNNGSYYGWNDAPRMALFHSSNTGNDACIHLRCQGRRSSGYDMGLYVTVFIDLYAPKSSNGNVTPTLRARGTSAPSGISGSEFTNDGRNASYVSYQDAAPDMTANP